MSSTRTFVMDLALDEDQPPQPGDRVGTARAHYTVVASRPVESRVWPNRWHLTLRRTDPPRVPPLDGTRYFPTRAYRRGERPDDHFGPVPESA